MTLYKQEGVSTTGGCLWSFIPLLILFPLYYVIREPLTYMLHNYRVRFLRRSWPICATAASTSERTAYYAQLAAAGQLGEFIRVS